MLSLASILSARLGFDRIELCVYVCESEARCITESQLAIVKPAKCKASTPSAPRDHILSAADAFSVKVFCSFA